MYTLAQLTESALHLGSPLAVAERDAIEQIHHPIAGSGGNQSHWSIGRHDDE